MRLEDKKVDERKKFNVNFQAHSVHYRKWKNFLVSLPRRRDSKLMKINDILSAFVMVQLLCVCETAENAIKSRRML